VDHLDRVWRDGDSDYGMGFINEIHSMDIFVNWRWRYGGRYSDHPAKNPGWQHSMLEAPGGGGPWTSRQFRINVDRSGFNRPSERWGSIHITVGHFLIALVFSVPPILWMVKRRRRMRLAAVTAGKCPTCGYDMRANLERCSECGTSLPDQFRTSRMPVCAVWMGLFFPPWILAGCPPLPWTIGEILVRGKAAIFFALAGSCLAVAFSAISLRRVKQSNGLLGGWYYAFCGLLFASFWLVAELTIIWHVYSYRNK